MSRPSISRTVIVLELVGFGLVVVVLWLDEALDLPHCLLGARATPFNYVESLLETVFVLALGAGVVLATRWLLRRISRLEGVLPVCASCKRIRTPDADPEQQDSWQNMEAYLAQRADVGFSHGLCPECVKKLYPDHWQEILGDEAETRN